MLNELLGLCFSDEITMLQFSSDMAVVMVTETYYTAKKNNTAKLGFQGHLEYAHMRGRNVVQS